MGGKIGKSVNFQKIQKCKKFFQEVVDNRCEFQHSSFHVDCSFDAKLVSKTWKYRSTKKLRKHVCQLILV